MKSRLLVVVSCLFVALSGCSPADVMRGALKRIAPDDDEALAMQCLTELSARDFDAVKSRLDRSLVSDSVESELTAMANALTNEEPVSIELVGCNIFHSSGNRRSTLTYQFQFAKTWALATVVIDTEDAIKRVVGFHVNQTSRSLEEMNAFTLSGKSLRHYVILAFAIAIPLLITVALVRCIRTLGLKRKWLWIVFILCGLGSLGLNWTTGEILFNPLSISVHFFGVSAVKLGLYASWIITVSLPLGAIIFLLRRKKLAAGAPPPMPPTTSGPSGS